MIAHEPTYAGPAVCGWCTTDLRAGSPRTFATIRLLIAAEAPRLEGLRELAAREGEEATVAIHEVCAEPVLEAAREALTHKEGER